MNAQPFSRSMLELTPCLLIFTSMSDPGVNIFFTYIWVRPIDDKKENGPPYILSLPALFLV